MEKVPAGMPPGRCAKEFRIRYGQPVIRPGAASLPRPLWTPLTSCFQNCKIEFCSIILQFCRCGGLFDAKGNPDGFLSHYPSLRSFRLGRFLDSLAYITYRGAVFHPPERVDFVERRTCESKCVFLVLVT